MANSSEHRDFPADQVVELVRSAVGERFAADITDQYIGGITIRVIPIKPYGDELEVDVYWADPPPNERYTVDVTHIVRSETHRATDHDLDAPLIGHVVADVMASVFGPYFTEG